MDWNNVNLKDAYERDQNILDPYSFETLLLEISCNLKEENLTRYEIRKHAESVIRAKYDEALNILADNLDNIVNQAREERE